MSLSGVAALVWYFGFGLTHFIQAVVDSPQSHHDHRQYFNTKIMLSPLGGSFGSTSSLDSMTLAAGSSGANTETITFSFAAAGWLQVYLFGAAHALIANIPGCRITGMFDGEITATAETSSKPPPDSVVENDENDDDHDIKAASAATEGLTGGDRADSVAPGRIRFAGSSAGSLAGAAILLGADMKELLEYAVTCANYARSAWYRPFEIRRFVEDGVQRFAVSMFDRAPGAPGTPGTPSAAAARNAGPPPSAEATTTSATQNMSSPPPTAATTTAGQGGDAAYNSDNDGADGEPVPPQGVWRGSEYFFPAHVKKQLTERLQIFATSLPWLESVVFDDLRSTGDLEEALVASCNLVPLAGLPFRLRRTGAWVVDGGLRAFQPRKGEPGVVTISAMYFNVTDVAPSRYVPMWWGLYPPCEAQYRALFALGHNDTLNHLWKRGMAPRPAGGEAAERARLLPIETGSIPTQNATWTGIALDILAGIFYMGVLRLFALVGIYAELWFVSSLCFIATVFHEFFPRAFDFLIGTRSLRNRRAGGRIDTARDFVAVVRNLLSARTWLHLAIGYRSANTKRLETYSRLYRFFRPFVSGEPIEKLKSI